MNPIKACIECGFCYSDGTTSTDGFDVGSIMKCKKSGMVLDSFYEHPGNEFIDRNVVSCCPLNKSELDLPKKTKKANKPKVTDSNYVSLIADIDELKWFFDNVLPPLAPTEIIFLSLSARNKYLTEEERLHYGLGRTEMFTKTIVREHTWEKFLKTIRRFECNEAGYLTKNGLPIPSKTLVCYININPSNTLKALNEFNKIINEYMFELSNVAVKSIPADNILNRINKIDNNLMTCYQQATGTRHWIDFDLDVDKGWKAHEDEVLKKWMLAKGLKTFYWLDMKSGYHLLIKKDELKFNPSELIEEINFCYSDWVCDEYEGDLDTIHDKIDNAEIIKNDNAMIALPGTFQGGHIVRVLNK